MGSSSSSRSALRRDGSGQHGLGHLTAAEPDDGPRQLRLRKAQPQEGRTGHVPKGQSPLLLEPFHEPVLPVDKPMTLPLLGGLDAGSYPIQLLFPGDEVLVSREGEIVQRHILRELRQLLHTGHGALGAEGDEPAVRSDATLHHLDQGRFAASVHADKADMIPRPDFERYIGKEDPVGKLLPHLYNIHDSHTFPYAV